MVRAWFVALRSNWDECVCVSFGVDDDDQGPIRNRNGYP